MIKAADLPAVRAQAEAATPANNQSRSTVASAAPPVVPGYPVRKLVLEDGRYVVAEPEE